MKITYLDQTAVTHASQPACVLTIGNFDGLHLGHQAMLATTIDLAKQKGLATAVMVFEPMPKEFFAPRNTPARLTNLIESQLAFKAYQHQGQGIDELIIAEFNEVFRSLSAKDFAKMLTDQLNVKAVVLGDDFRFGQDRTGDCQFLQQQGLEVSVLNTVTTPTVDISVSSQPNPSSLIQQPQRISSTLVRRLLAEGKIQQANQLLGRDYCIVGQVLHGDKIGRTLNFPTANVALDRLKPALHGIFAVDVQVLDKQGKVVNNAWEALAVDNQHGVAGVDEDSLFGTANIGTRPAVNGKEWRLEVHFPQFKGNLYDKVLKVRFLHFLHGERQYAGLPELKTGIQNDVVELLEWRAMQDK